MGRGKSEEDKDGRESAQSMYVCREKEIRRRITGID
jgi:hypothetical protein